MLKKESKRRRTRAEIEEEKQEEILKRQKLAEDQQELQSLRARMQGAEQQAMNNKGAAELLSQMINAGHIKQDSENTIILNAQNGEHRFGINAPQPEVQVDFERDVEDEYQQDNGGIGQ